MTENMNIESQCNKYFLEYNSSHKLNLLTPESDWHLISLHNITTESQIKVMRIKEMITN